MSRFYLSSALVLIFLLGIGASLLVYQASQRVAHSNQELIERATADLDAISWFRSDLSEHERLAYELYGAIDADRLAPMLHEQRRHVEAQIPGLLGRGLSSADLKVLEAHWMSIISQVDALIENISARLTDWDAARDQLGAITHHRQLIDQLQRGLPGLVDGLEHGRFSFGGGTVFIIQ